MTDAAFLQSLPQLSFALVLILCRVGMVIMLLPGLGEAEAPALTRVGLAGGVSILLLPSLSPSLSAAENQYSGFQLIFSEILAGAAIGWLARLPALALNMAGAFVSLLLGLSSVLQPDPALGGQTSALARAFGLVAPVLILASGLYASPLQALVGSYHLVQPGGMLPASDLTASVIDFFGKAMLLALQLSAPFLLAGMVWQIAVGLLARISPQLQAFSVAAPGQILGGLILLGILAVRLLSVWQSEVSTTWSALPGA